MTSQKPHQNSQQIQGYGGLGLTWTVAGGGETASSRMNRWLLRVCQLVLLGLLFSGCATESESAKRHQRKPDWEKRWGVEFVALRSVANGYMIDFRYKVIDADKAAQLSNRKFKPYLIDEATGAKLLVPNTPKVGPLRQTSVKPVAGKVYFMFFSNPGRFVKPGSRVTIVIGDFRVEHLVIQ